MANAQTMGSYHKQERAEYLCARANAQRPISEASHLNLNDLLANPVSARPLRAHDSLVAFRPPQVDCCLNTR